MRPAEKPGRLFRLLLGLLLLLAQAQSLPWAAEEVVVESANPPSAEQGTVSLDVEITGKGFDRGSKAKFFVTGTTDPGGVTVNATTFKGATRLIANITVADNAVVGKFDVVVQTSQGRSGKGTEIFSVVQKGNKASSCPTPTPVLTSVSSCSLTWPGCLDTSFGAGGIDIMNTSGSHPVTTDIDIAHVVAIQPDGKIVVAGSSRNAAGGGDDTVILRYNFDGSLDSTFGSAGMVRLSMSRVSDIALQPNGKIILAGFGFSLVRLDLNGALDTSFGNGGMASTTFGKGKNAGGIAWALALQSDGKIVVGGGGNSSKWDIARFNANGTLDVTFANNGKLEVEAGGGSAWAVAFQSVTIGLGSEQRILVGGAMRPVVGQGEDFGLIRLTPSGALDSSFGPSGNGQVVKDFCGEQDRVRGIGLDSSNRIVLGGFARINNGSSVQANFALARFTQDGVLDATFGDGVTERMGTSVVSFLGGRHTVWGLGIQPDGKILLSGATDTGDGAATYVALARFNADGTRDSTFGTGGVVATDASDGVTLTDSSGQKLALQADGKIVVVGSAAANGGYNFLVVRYWQ